MTAPAETKQNSVRIIQTHGDAPILISSGYQDLAIRAGTVVVVDGRTFTFADDTPIALHGLTPGQDYGVDFDGNGKPLFGLVTSNPLTSGWIAGFHFAPGGRSLGRAGSDTTPAINPYSIWDIAFRPTCEDPRGMAMVAFGPARRFWADIYLLGAEHVENGTSRFGVAIADGRDLPGRTDGKGRVKKFDYAIAAEIYAHHGKRMLGAEEFFAAAYGVKERCSRSGEPVLTGEMLDGSERFISAHGLFDVTGTMWQWGTDGHPDDPRPSLFGGSWLFGSDAGSRYARLGCWPGLSNGGFSARGGSDHLSPA